MQWTGEVKTGFTTGVPWQPANANYMTINVAAQDEDKLSLLNHYRSLVHLRNEHAALQTGDYMPFSTSCRLLYPILRVDEEEAIIVLANLGRQAQEGCTLSIDEGTPAGDYELDVLMGSGEFSPISFDANGSVNEYVLPDFIEPWAYYILKLQP
jgi:glycosidase